MVCVELNPVRVKVAKRLEASDDTSISLLWGHYTVADPAVRNTVDLQITALSCLSLLVIHTSRV